MGKFAKNLTGAFAILLAFFAFALGVGVGPVFLLIWLNVPPLVGMPILLTVWCFAGALAFAIDQQGKPS